MQMDEEKQSKYLVIYTKLDDFGKETEQTNKTLCYAENIHEAKQMVAEEIADVEICLEQLKYLLRNKGQVERRKKQKIKRTQERLNK